MGKQRDLARRQVARELDDGGLTDQDLLDLAVGGKSRILRYAARRVMARRRARGGA